MSRLTIDEIEAIATGQLARAKHRELTGEELAWMEFPCWEAVAFTMQAVRESEAAVTDLLNDR